MLYLSPVRPDFQPTKITYIFSSIISNNFSGFCCTITDYITLTKENIICLGNKKKAKENPSYNIFKTTGDLPTKSLLNQCLKCPNEYTATLLGR